MSEDDIKMKTLFGMPLFVSASVPKDEVRFVDPITRKIVGRLILSKLALIQKEKP